MKWLRGDRFKVVFLEVGNTAIGPMTGENCRDVLSVFSNEIDYRSQTRLP